MLEDLPPEFQLPEGTDPELLSLALALVGEYRTYSTDGDPSTGFNEPDITRLRAAFGGLLPRILARGLIGQEGESLPLLPLIAELIDKFFYLTDDGAGGQTWAVLPIADILRAAELVDFDTQITAEVQSSVAPIIAAISLNAPFNTRFPTQAELIADLNYPDQAWGIGFDTLNIFQKSGPSGAGEWVIADAQPLASLPGSASLADLQILQTRIDQLEAQLTMFTDLSARIDRLDAFHPFEAPEFTSLIPSVLTPDGTPIAPIDLNDFVTDSDSASLTFSVDQLPDGLSLVGSIISGTPTTFGPVIVSTVTAEDEGARSDSAQINFTIYDSTQPAPVQLEWSAIPPQSVFVGQTIAPIVYANFINDATGVTFTADNLPPGVTETNGILSGTPTASSTFTITATASNASSPPTVITHRITVTIPPFDPGALGGFGGGSSGGFFAEFF